MSATNEPAHLTSRIADFVVSTTLADIPSATVSIAARSIFDGIGLAVAGSRSPVAKIVAEQVGSLGALADEAHVLGTGMATASRFAALLNGISIHADDYDDTQLASRSDRVYGLLTHPTAPVLPVVLALGEQFGSRWDAALEAYILGVEVETTLCEASNPAHYLRGFHSTATFGTLGAAIAAAKLYGLTLDETVRCIGIAVSLAAGVRQNFGTMMKPFHAGRAAENGIVAADLARRGITATAVGLEGPSGYYRAAAGDFDGTAVSELGNPWTLERPGVSIKPFPSGSLSHPTMMTVKQLVSQNNIHPADVRHIDVVTAAHMASALIYHDPRTVLEAKFSMEFCAAVMALGMAGGLETFTESVVFAPDVRDMMRRISFSTSDTVEAAGVDRMRSLVRIALKSGEVVEDSSDFAYGSPALPMSEDDLANKFAGCLNVAGIETDVAAVLAQHVRYVDASTPVAQIVREVTDAVALRVDAQGDGQTKGMVSNSDARTEFGSEQSRASR